MVRNVGSFDGNGGGDSIIISFFYKNIIKANTSLVGLNVPALVGEEHQQGWRL